MKLYAVSMYANIKYNYRLHTLLWHYYTFDITLLISVIMNNPKPIVGQPAVLLVNRSLYRIHKSHIPF